MFCGPVFVLWNPPLAAALLIAYGEVVNLPFIMIQRYNRFRIAAVLQRVGR
jgi:glycosyl-4,4'-diaponeurosporenoate acyltransferase